MLIALQKKELYCYLLISDIVLFLCNCLTFNWVDYGFMINFTVRMLREELQLLHEPGSYVGEVIKVMGKSKVLVKVFTI